MTRITCGPSAILRDMIRRGFIRETAVGKYEITEEGKAQVAKAVAQREAA